jgi:IS5 family transposase
VSVKQLFSLKKQVELYPSFPLFLGMASSDTIADEITICRYRELFSRLGLEKKLFAAFNLIIPCGLPQGIN